MIGLLLIVIGGTDRDGRGPFVKPGRIRGRSGWYPTTDQHWRDRMRRTASFSVVVGLITLLAACSGSGATATPTTAAPSQSAAPSSSEASGAPSASSATPSESAGASAAAGAVTLAVGDSKLGKIVVDGQGRTLYAFTKDSAGTPTCNGGCANSWPGLLATGEVKAGTGIDDGDISTVDRTDGGGKQVKFYQWPLYYFGNDAAPGDTNGQGLNGVWYVVGPDGKLIK